MVSNFSNLEAMGKDMYLIEKQAISTEKLEALDGEAFAMDVMSNNPNPMITI